ncbi:VCAM1 protein, partial [Polypterus senegalus]
ESCDVEFSSPKVIVRYGDPVNVTCHTNRTDIRATGWEASVGATRQDNSNSAVWNVSSLTVWDAEPKCYINFRADPKQCDKPLNLIIYRVEAGCDVVITPSSIFVKSGDPVRVTCSTNRKDFKAIGWNAPVSPVMKDKGGKAIWSVDNLTIRDAEVRCFLNLSAPPYHCEKKLHLFVYNLPEPTLELERGIHVNDTVNVTCSVKGQHPTNTTQRLLIPGLKLNLSSVNGKPVISNFKARKEHNGLKVICETHLHLPTATYRRNSSVTLNVSFPPVISPRLPVKPLITAGWSLESQLTCAADGNPRPNIRWFKDDKVVEPSKVMDWGDEGLYECVAENTHGRTRRSVAIVITHDYLPRIAGTSAVILVFVLIIVIIFYVIYYTKNKTGQYRIEDRKIMFTKQGVGLNGGTDHIVFTPLITL